MFLEVVACLVLLAIIVIGGIVSLFLKRRSVGGGGEESDEESDEAGMGDEESGGPIALCRKGLKNFHGGCYTTEEISAIRAAVQNPSEFTRTIKLDGASVRTLPYRHHNERTNTFIAKRLIAQPDRGMLLCAIEFLTLHLNLHSSTSQSKIVLVVGEIDMDVLAVTFPDFTFVKFGASPLVVRPNILFGGAVFDAMTAATQYPSAMFICTGGRGAGETDADFMAKQMKWVTTLAPSAFCIVFIPYHSNFTYLGGTIVYIPWNDPGSLTSILVGTTPFKNRKYDSSYNDQLYYHNNVVRVWMQKEGGHGTTVAGSYQHCYDCWAENVIATSAHAKMPALDTTSRKKKRVTFVNTDDVLNP
jgi:hypothetical protein